jgi:hypothetical protein
MTLHAASPRESPWASVDVAPFRLPEHRRVLSLARSLGRAGLVVLCLALWGSLASEVWRADVADEASIDRGPVVVVVDAYDSR